jgi:hypothetical protein
VKAHRHLGDADLLRAALEGASSECPECAARAAELAGVAGRMRALLVHESELDARRDAAVAELVLSRTTRARVAAPERSTWQRRALASSAGRAAAAAILLALASLPVVAWVAWRAPSRETPLNTRLESPRGLSLPEPAEPQRSPRVAELEPRVASVERESADADPAEFARARAAERELLRRAPAPSFDGDPAELDRVARLLALRGRVLDGGEKPGELATSAPSDEDSALEQALWCEAALDALVLRDAREPALEPLLRFLARSQATAVAPLDFACAVLARAERLGALDAEAGARLRELQRARPELARGRPSAPLDAAWRASLSQAVRELARSGAGAERGGASQRLISRWTADEI